MMKNEKRVELNISIVTVLWFEFKNFKFNLIEYKCLYCNENYQNKVDEKLKERVFNSNKTL